MGISEVLMKGYVGSVLMLLGNNPSQFSRLIRSRVARWSALADHLLGCVQGWHRLETDAVALRASEEWVSTSLAEESLSMPGPYQASSLHKCDPQCVVCRTRHREGFRPEFWTRWGVGLCVSALS